MQFISDEALNELKHDVPVLVKSSNLRQYQPSKMDTTPQYFPPSKKSNSLTRTNVNYYICQSKTIPCISALATNSSNSKNYAPVRTSVNLNNNNINNNKNKNNNFASFIRNTNYQYPTTNKSNSLRTMPNSKTMPVISNYNTYYSYRTNNYYDSPAQR